MFKKFFSKKNKPLTEFEKKQKALFEESNGLVELKKINEDESNVTINGDQLSGHDEQSKLIREMTADSEIPYFDGKVEHLYQLKRTKQKEVCPRCEAALVRHYAGFAYAVLDFPNRLCNAPAGYFCPTCPTVVVDEAFVEQAILGDFQFNGVFAIETETHETQLFKTKNGNKVMYVLNEEEQVEELLEMNRPISNRLAVQRQKSKSRGRNKAAKAARKKRRKK